MNTWHNFLLAFLTQVVPHLVKYIDNLTNIYVRFNRKRLKGRTGEEDCRISLSTLYHVSTHLAQRRLFMPSRTVRNNMCLSPDAYELFYL
jgi:isoleucyl-tRNA synthetase